METERLGRRLRCRQATLEAWTRGSGGVVLVEGQGNPPAAFSGYIRRESKMMPSFLALAKGKLNCSWRWGDYHGKSRHWVESRWAGGMNKVVLS